MADEKSLINWEGLASKATAAIGKAFTAASSKIVEGIELGIEYNAQMEKQIEGTGQTFNNMVASLKDNSMAFLGDLSAGLFDIAKNDALPQIGVWLEELQTGFTESGVEGLSEAMGNVLSEMVAKIEESAPKIIEGALGIVQLLATTLVENVGMIAEAAVPIGATLLAALLECLPLLLEGMGQLIIGLSQGLVDAIPIIAETIPNIILAIVEAISTNVPSIIEAGTQLLSALVEALPTIIENIVAVLPDIITAIIDAVMASIPEIIEGGIQLFIALVEALPTIIDTIVAALPEIIGAVLKALVDATPQIISAGVDLFIALIENLPTVIEEIVKAIPKIIDGIANGLAKGIPDIIKIGGDLIRGLWQGISDVAEWLWGKVSGFFSSLTDKIKNFFGIESPSKLFEEEIGKNLALGLAVGIEKYEDEPLAAAKKMVNSTAIAAFAGPSLPSLDFMIPFGYTWPMQGTSQSSAYSPRYEYRVEKLADYFVIREEADIRRISVELGKYLIQQNRGKGLT